jgi:hypothetical protein
MRTLSANPSLSDRVVRKLHLIAGRLHRRCRTRTARIIYGFPPFRNFNPRSKIVTFKAYCADVPEFPSASPPPANWYLKLQPPQSIVRAPSVCLDDAQAAMFSQGTRRYQSGAQTELPETFLACVQHARIQTDGFLVLSKRNDIFFESALNKTEVLEDSGILDRLLPRRCRTLAGAPCLLAHPWTDGYYHWMFEVLPRLSVLEQFPSLAATPLIVPQELNAFQRESLSLLGIPGDRLLQTEHGFFEAERLYFPQVPAPTGNPSPQAVSWLRSRFQATRPSVPTADTGLLYITRRDAPQRRLLNEEAVLDLLRPMGFQPVSLAGMPLAEQVRLFSRARFVIAPHGAGLTNMVFAPQGAKLIEFFGENYINGCYWALASICGHRHACLIGPAVGLDYYIPIEALKAILRRLRLAPGPQFACNGISGEKAAV